MKSLGVLLDCSRNVVYTIAALKKYIKILSRMGYTQLQLYTEDTLQIDGEEQFGYLRGRYAAEEMMELDAFSRKNGIELVPCIQTLAHMWGLTRWWDYYECTDTSDILLADEERTYKLLDNVFKTCARIFTSRRINIGMDEAEMTGLGKYLQKHGYRNRFEVLLGHLQKVCAIAEKYGFKPMMWSDMFFKLASGGNYYAEQPISIPEEVINAVPKNLQLIYWDYYTENRKVYDAMLSSHRKFGNDIIFAGGAWAWSGFVPHNRLSIRRNNIALAACAEQGIDEILITSWRDDGGECSLFGNLPSLWYAAENSRGNFDEASIKSGFKKIAGIDLEGFLLLDEPDIIDGEVKQVNPSKYMLYSDPFLGWLDCSVQEERCKKFEVLKNKLLEYASDKNFGYIFKCVAELCNVLEIKYALGVRTRRAYKSGGNELDTLIIDYSEAEKRLERFYRAFKKQRERECKSFGFEIHDIRLGGLISRIRNCKEQLINYRKGRIKFIDTLEEKIIPMSHDYKMGTPIEYNMWISTAMIKPLH